MSKKKIKPVVSGPVINQSYELVATSALTPHPRNVNRGDLVAIGGSIAENGFYGAIVAQKSTGHILAGNHRYEAAKTAGIAEVPVTWVDVDDDRALRILLADNRTTRLGHDDQEALAVLLEEIQSNSETLDGTGFSHEDLEAILAGLGNEVLDSPEFAPVSEAEQGRLDRKKPVICPNCYHEFSPD